MHLIALMHSSSRNQIERMVMPDEIIMSSESKSPEAASISATGNESVSFSVSHAVALCAAGLLVCFFLPWVNILIGKLSGFDFAKDSSQYYFLWLLPFCCVVTFLAAISKNPIRVVAQITGCLPFAILGYGLSQVGADLLKLLEIGAYFGFALGLALLILPARHK